MSKEETPTAFGIRMIREDAVEKFVEKLTSELNKELRQSEKDYSFFSGLNGDVRKVARAEGECYAYKTAIKKAGEKL